MQNLKLAPLAIAAMMLSTLASAQTDSSVQMYGQVTAGVTMLNHQGPGEGSSLTYVGNNEFAMSILGFRGTEDLGGGMKALYRLEAGLTSNNGGQANPEPVGTQKLFNRQSYVGLNFGELGEVTVGRQFTAGVDRAIRTLDIYNLAGQSAKNTPTALFGVNKYGAAANPTVNPAYDNRSDSNVKYRLDVPSAGLQMGASFGFNDGAGRNYSLDVGQGNKDYQVGAMWERYEAPFQFANGTPTQDTYMLGGNFALGPTRIYISYLDNKAGTAIAAQAQIGSPKQEDKLWHLGARWTVQAGLDLTAALYSDKGTAINNVAGRNGTKTTWVASADYYFSKRTSVNVGLYANQLKDGYRLDPVNGSLLAGHATSAAAPTTGSAIVGETVGIIHRF